MHVALAGPTPAQCQISLHRPTAGASMSFGYSFITLGLSIAEGNTHGTVMGRDASPPDKTFGVFNALGAM